MAPLPTDAVASTPILYRIDAHDRIVEVNPAWEQFAAENDGRAMSRKDVIGRDLFSCITDPTLEHLYSELIARARKGKPVKFLFRCDAPSCRRTFEMRIRAGADGTVEFASTLRNAEPRPRVALLDSSQPRNAELLRVCSWCQRINVRGSWFPVEDAVNILGLMQDAALPGLTHGICGDCRATMSAAIAGSEEPPGAFRAAPR